MKKQFSFMQFALRFLTCALVVSVGIYAYMQRLTTSQHKEIIIALQEFAAQDATHIEIQVTQDLNLLSAVAASISVWPEMNDQELLRLLQTEREQNYFKNVEFVRPSGIAQLDDGTLLDVSQEKHFQLAMQGQATISSRKADLLDGESILVEAVPVRIQGKIVGALMATRRTGDFGRTLDMQSFNGNGYSLLVEADGDKVVESYHKNAISGLYNIFDMPDDPNHLLRQQVLKDFAAHEGGVVKYNSKHNGILYVSYQPLQVNDWFVLSVVPEKFITRLTQNFLTLLPLLCILVAVASFMLGCYVWDMWPSLKRSITEPNEEK